MENLLKTTSDIVKKIGLTLKENSKLAKENKKLIESNKKLIEDCDVSIGFYNQELERRNTPSFKKLIESLKTIS